MKTAEKNTTATKAKATAAKTKAAPSKSKTTSKTSATGVVKAKTSAADGLRELFVDSLKDLLNYNGKLIWLEKHAS